MTATINPLNIDEQDTLMNLEDVAKMLGNISTRSVRRLIARGDLPKPVKVLSSPRLYRSDILAYFERLKIKRASQGKH